MGNSMTEIPSNQDILALQGQLAGVIAALNMHLKRSEELVAEMEQLQFEISQLTPEAKS